MAIKIGKIVGSDRLLGTDDDDLLIALGAKTTLDGGKGNDLLLGGLNNDILIGGQGADLLSGGAGTDTADYSASSAGVNVNLTIGKGAGGDAQGDILVSIENAVGSAFDDQLTGDTGNNVLTGGAGKDVFALTKGKDVITDFHPGLIGAPKEVLIDFEDTAPGPVSNGYKGLNWLNTWSGTTTYPVKDSPTDVVGYAPDTDAVSFTSPTDFDLVSFAISGGSDGLLTVSISAFDDGSLVGYADLVTVDGLRWVFAPDPDQFPYSSRFTFTSIDELRIQNLATGTTDFAFDDIKVSYPGTPGEGDRIDVPVGTNVSTLVASAVSNGKGGTMLTHAEGKLELLGVDPASVSADWFV